ncbi:MAG: energy-coupling factor transporter transmembrane component T family protein [Candidatus Bathyarchaeota archaeon]
MLEKLTQRFLEGLAETINTLNREVVNPPFNPTITILSALVFTSLAAFTIDFKAPLLVLVVSVFLVVLTRIPMYSWIRVVIFTFFWVFLVSIPLPFITSGKPLIELSMLLTTLKVSFEGLNLMISFIVRVVSATAIFTSFILILGWKKTMEGLKGLGVPYEVIFFLMLSIIHIPLFLREISKMLSAREARIIKKVKFRQVWWMLSTVIGDILLKTHEHSWRVEKAIKARSLTSSDLHFKSSVKVSINRNELMLLLLLFTCVLVSFIRL